jgi:hypothetical protein
VSELLPARSSRNNPQDLVGGRKRPIDEVADVRLELCAKAPRLFGAAIPLQVDQQLTFLSEKATPPIRRGAMVVRLCVSCGDLVLTDPVIKAEIANIACRNGKADEELVGLQLVHEVEAAGKSVLGTLDERARVLVAPLREQRRPPPSNQIDRRATDPARSRGGAPACKQAMVEEPLKPVLTVPWSRKEECLNLVSAQVAVRVQLLQDGQVTDGRLDFVL